MNYAKYVGAGRRIGAGIWELAPAVANPAWAATGDADTANYSPDTSQSPSPANTSQEQTTRNDSLGNDTGDGDGANADDSDEDSTDGDGNAADEGFADTDVADIEPDPTALDTADVLEVDTGDDAEPTDPEDAVETAPEQAEIPDAPDPIPPAAQDSAVPQSASRHCRHQGNRCTSTPATTLRSLNPIPLRPRTSRTATRPTR